MNLGAIKLSLILFGLSVMLKYQAWRHPAFRERLKEKGLTLILTDEAKKFVIKKGSNTDFGARPLRRAIEGFVEDPLSEELLKGEFQGKDTVLVDVKMVGDKKQLFFEGQTRGTGEAVAAGAPAADAGASGESTAS